MKAWQVSEWCEPEEIAGMAVLLASRAGNWITGQTIVIDGGATIAGG